MSVVIQSVDMTGLDRFTGELQKVIGLTSSQATKWSAGLLAKELTQKAPPKNLKKSQEGAERSVRSVFAPAPKVNVRQASQIASGMQWFYASPRVIVGAKNGRDMRQMNAPGTLGKVAKSNQMAKTFWNNKSKLGKKWIDHGRRKRHGGKQHVMELNRFIVKKASLSRFTKIVRDSYGKLKASWALSWEQLGASGPIPGWVKKHFGEVKSNGSMLIVDLESKNPSVTMRSTASGVESEYSLSTIHAAVKSRAAKMQKDLQHYYSGLKNADDFKKKFNPTNN